MEIKLKPKQGNWLEHSKLPSFCTQRRAYIQSFFSTFLSLCIDAFSGYMPPEYAVHGRYSMKSDVFSFGVIVLEIISGKKIKVFYDPEHSLNLLGHVSAINLHLPI